MQGGVAENTPEWLDDWRKHGFVRLSQVLPHVLIDQHLADITPIFQRHGALHNERLIDWPADRRAALNAAVNALDHEGTASFALSMHESLMQRFRLLFEAEPVRSSVSTALWESGDRAAHFDTSFVSTTPEDHVCRAWCALEDIHPDSGIFYVVPGTHRTARPRILADMLRERPAFVHLLDRFSTDRESARAAWRQEMMPILFGRIKAAIEGVPRMTFPIRKGDVVLFSPNVVHGTMPRADPELSRRVMISEWRARTAMIYHPGEHFGAGFDHRNRPGVGIRADRDAMQSSLGLYCDPYRPPYP